MSGNGKKRTPLVADRRYRGGKAPVKKTGKAAATPKRKPNARKRAKPAVKRGPIGRVFAFVWSIVSRILGLLWGIVWRGGVAVSLIIAGAVLYYTTTLPPVEDLVDGRARGSVTMIDQYGEVFARRGDRFGGMITFDSVSPHLSNAIMATEDRRFYWHPGVDPIGIASAVVNNLRGTGGLRGGSTLTQQTAKLLCNGQPFDPADWDSEAAYEADCRQATLWRKAQEAVYAMAMEVVYTKEEILTIYMNRAYMGGSSFGAEAASSRFFGINSSELTPQQSAILAGLLQAPSVLSPSNNYDRSWARAQTVLRLMHEQGFLDDDQYLIARTNPPELGQGAQTALPGGYFADWVMRTGPEFFTRDTTEDVVIDTTLDPRIQLAAEQAVLSVFADGTLRADSTVQTAVVVMSADGAVRGMVGGVDVRASDVFNRATNAVRQPGSAFKPFVFAAALDLGYSPYDQINDAPTCWTTPGSGEWCPENYSDDFIGPITLLDALISSRNIPAIVLSETVGRDIVRTVASGFGINRELADTPALALGASEVTLLQLTGAYAGILNGGSSVAPYGLRSLRIRGDDTPLMEQSGGIGERVIQSGPAQQMTWMMYQVVEQGTGARAQIQGHQLAGKTGTTNENRDAWFVGFSGEYVVGVWMGFDDNAPMRGVTGSGVPAEIWRRTMEGVLDGTPPVPLPMVAPEPAAGGIVQLNGSLVISDAELDAMLAQEFGVVDTTPTTPQPATTTSSAVDRALESIFGPPDQ